MPFTSTHEGDFSALRKPAPYAKSIVAALVAGLGSLYQALDGDPSVVTGQEWVAIAMTTLTALGVVFGVPNKDPKAEHQDESVQPPADQGYPDQPQDDGPWEH